MPRNRRLGGRWSACFALGALLAVATPVVVAAESAPSIPPTASASPASPARAAFDWRSAVLYFAIVDRFADGDTTNNSDVDTTAKGTFHGGDLKGLTKHLDEIAGLGVNALWITPVVKNIPKYVTGAGFPDWGYHGYWADDFYALDPRFGSEDDLKALVAAAHQRGIKVLLDIVYNHAGYDSRYLADPKFKDWFRREDRGTCGSDDLTSCLAGLPDFKTERPEVADYLMKAHLDLAKRTGLDGFRLDTVKHVDHPFWKEHRQRTRTELGADFFLLGEVWGGDAQVMDPYFAGDEMDAGFDFGFQGSTLGFVMGRGRAVAYDRYLKSREKVRGGYHLAHFLSSHDVPGALFQLQGNKEQFRLAAILQLTTAGIPTIYYGEEVGRLGGDWPDNRSPMPWGTKGIAPGKGIPRDEALRADYQKLIAIRRDHPALWRGTHQGLVTDQPNVYVFARTDAETGAVVVVAVNRGATPATASFAAPAVWGDRPVRDLFGGAAIARGEGPLQVEVPAMGARILAP